MKERSMNPWYQQYVADRMTEPKAVETLRLQHDIGTIMKTMKQRSRTGAIAHSKLQSIASQDQQIERFIDCWHRGNEAIAEASRLLVQMVEQDERAFDRIADKLPDVSVAALETLYLCGQKNVDPALIWQNPQGMRRILRLRDAELRTVMEHGLPVAREGKPTENKEIIRITAADCALAINDDRVRTPSEQLEILRAKHVPGNGDTSARFVIRPDGMVQFSDGSVFSPAQLEHIAAQAKQKSLESLNDAIKGNQIK